MVQDYIKRIIASLIILSYIFISSAQAQTSVRPTTYTATGFLALGAAASIQQQQQRCRQTGVGCRNNSSYNQPRFSFSEIWRDANNLNNYNNPANHHNIITGTNIVSGVGGL